MPKPDLAKPLPDRGHDGLRQWLQQAVADLGDSFLLTDVLFALADTARADLDTSTADADDHLLLIDVLFALLDEMATRIAVLEEAASPNASS